MAAPAPKCEGTTGRPGNGTIALYGRKVCLTCGNVVFENKDGKLRSHKAIPYEHNGIRP